MIRIASSRDLPRLLESLYEHAAEYRRIVVCSPFIDEHSILTTVRMLVRARRQGVALVVITRPEAGERLLAELPGHPAWWGESIRVISELHAKAYLGIGRRVKMTRGVVTSANLTLAGLGQNIEIGVVASASSDAGLRFIGELDSKLRDLKASARGIIALHTDRKAS